MKKLLLLLSLSFTLQSFAQMNIVSYAGNNGKETFFSYGNVIATKQNGVITLDEKYWNYSKTTSKYLNQFLGRPAKELECIFTNLNN